jgi:hypothetical protein
VTLVCRPLPIVGWGDHCTVGMCLPAGPEMARHVVESARYLVCFDRSYKPACTTWPDLHVPA